MPYDDNLVSVQHMVARILELPADQVNCDVPIYHLKGWDNILHLTLVFAIEDETGHVLTPEDLKSCTSLRDIADLLDQAGAVSRH